MEVDQLKKNTLLAKYAAFTWGASYYAHIDFETVKPSHPMYLLKRAIATLGDDTTPKKYIGRNELGAIIPFVCHERPGLDGLELGAWFSVAYGALLRAEEAAQLKWADVCFPQGPGRPTHMTVTLRTTRHFTFKNHTDDVPFEFGPPSSSAHPDAVQLMWKWRAYTYRSDQQRVFRRTAEEARKALQKAAAAVLGGSPGDYGLHSFRSGGATDAEGDGKSLSEIMHVGRWRSAALFRYTRGGELAAKAVGMGGKAKRATRKAL